VHQFVGTREHTVDDKDLSNEQFVCKVVTEFMSFLREMKLSDDKWVSTCTNFLEMAYDFKEFVRAYCIGDSISIEFDYQKQVPAWEAMGQHKYVDIFYGQQEALYRDVPFSTLQEIRLNRVVRRYHASTGKRCVAHDEFLEHGNRFFSNFPLPKTLTSFAFQSNYVGIGLMCKWHTDIWCSTVWRGDDYTGNYKPSVDPSMTPEKKLIYEVFCLLKTHNVNPLRILFKNHL